VGLGGLVGRGVILATIVPERGAPFFCGIVGKVPKLPRSGEENQGTDLVVVLMHGNHVHTPP